MNPEVEALRILLVEDEAMLAFFLEDIVTDLGFQVAGSASTAAEAVRLARDGDVDFGLLDVNLGNGETSFEAAAILSDRGIPFAFVTGYGAAGVTSDFADAPVLRKPINIAALATVLEAAIGPANARAR